MRFLITGVTRGLGEALTHRLIADGNTVWGCGRDARRLDTLRQRYPAPHDFQPVNIADCQQVDAWCGRLIEGEQIPDAIVNNAAIMNAPSPLWKVPPEEFSALIDVNVKGSFYVLHAMLPLLRARGTGLIVNFSSGWGRSTSPEVAPYCASKWAIEGLTRALAQELPSDITTVALNPGVINTDMLRRCWGEGAAQFPDADAWAERAAVWFQDVPRTLHGQSVSL